MCCHLWKMYYHWSVEAFCKEAFGLFGLINIRRGEREAGEGVSVCSCYCILYIAKSMGTRSSVGELAIPKAWNYLWYCPTLFAAITVSTLLGRISRIWWKFCWGGGFVLNPGTSFRPLNSSEGKWHTKTSCIIVHIQLCDDILANAHLRV